MRPAVCLLSCLIVPGPAVEDSVVLRRGGGVAQGGDCQVVVVLPLVHLHTDTSELRGIDNRRKNPNNVFDHEGHSLL